MNALLITFTGLMQLYGHRKWVSDWDRSPSSGNKPSKAIVKKKDRRWNAE